MEEYRRLQKTCEIQAALSSSPQVRTALLEMAEEYRVRADFNDRHEAKPLPAGERTTRRRPEGWPEA